ncbi:MAG: von Willebrand factor type A domain-containing protein [Elusimicrobia bacterium]|nr:von Willebrand factor type A domain-containing protein [Elusimicrobiota bacterium]
MNENLEAERFSKELDCLLAGTKGSEPLDPELAKDMEFAERIVSSDKSGESKVRHSLKRRLLEQELAQYRPSRLKAWRVRPWVLASGLAALALVPLVEHFLVAPSSESGGTFKPGWDFMSRGGRFSDGSVPFEPGVNGMAPGSSAGRSADVVTPLNVKDPSALVMGPGAAAKSGSLGGGGAAWSAPPIRVARGGGRLESVPPRAAAAPASPAQGPALPASEENRRQSQQYYLSGIIYYDKGDFEKARNEWAHALQLDPDNPDAQAGLQRIYNLYGIQPPPVDREGYRYLQENDFQKAVDAPLSTFSIDVDVASYANVRRFLNQSRLPPADAVRVEEFINYFHYSYPEPQGAHPFTITADSADCPWNPKHKLVRVAIKGKSIPKEELPPSNLVFLIDSSGSMMDQDKLPLVQKSLRLLVNELRPQDRVAIVTYAGSAGLILDSTSGEDKADILSAIDRLQAGGTTAGAQGILLAYQVAAEHLLKKGNNRVILATDGDFNVGVTSDGELVRLIEQEREKGIFLTVLGVGQGNYQDAKMQQLADKGNGNYAYLDDISEAQKVLVSQLAGTLYAVAKDMKIQVEFNPARVQAYRLIGYEKRALKAEDFNNDKKDAGELGSGHTVTALYELIPPGVKASLPDVDELKYQKTAPAQAAQDKELLTVKVRYKDPDGTKSKLVSRPLVDKAQPWSEAVPDLKFAAAAAGFAMLLRGSAYSGDLSYAKVAAMAQAAEGKDADGYRGEFIRLVQKAQLLKGPEATLGN